MALKDLSIAAMLHVSGNWVDPKGDRKLLHRAPDPRHRAPGARRRARGPQGQGIEGRVDPTPEIKRFSDQQQPLDKRHDRKVRGGYNFLTGVAEMVDDPKQAGRVLRESATSSVPRASSSPSGATPKRQAKRNASRRGSTTRIGSSSRG